MQHGPNPRAPCFEHRQTHAAEPWRPEANQMKKEPINTEGQVTVKGEYKWWPFWVWQLVSLHNKTNETMTLQIRVNFTAAQSQCEFLSMSCTSNHLDDGYWTCFLFPGIEPNFVLQEWGRHVSTLICEQLAQVYSGKWWRTCCEGSIGMSFLFQLASGMTAKMSARHLSALGGQITKIKYLSGLWLVLSKHVQMILALFVRLGYE